jgi:hypothetical protein
MLLQAMLGTVWAFVAEKATGLTVMEQLFNPTTNGLVFFVGGSPALHICITDTHHEWGVH